MANSQLGAEIFKPADRYMSGQLALCGRKEALLTANESEYASVSTMLMKQRFANKKKLLLLK